MADWKVAWITGASSGIGRGLALALAERGVTVAISARSTGVLAELAASRPGLHAFPADVTDGPAMAATVAGIEAELGPIDLAILNAGWWQPVGASELTAELAAKAMAVNYSGVVNGLEHLLPRFLARRRGHIAIVASVAGYRGLPRSLVYAPTKAALISLAEGLKPELDAAGIDLSLVNPGFVATPMTAANDFPMPFLLEEGDAVRRILAGLERRRFEIAFPRRLAWTLKLLRVLPYPLYFALVRRLAPARRGERS